MCFDICNIRVSIRVRGLHSGSWASVQVWCSNIQKIFCKSSEISVGKLWQVTPCNLKTKEMFLQLTHVCEPDCPEGQFETDGLNGVGRTRTACDERNSRSVQTSLEPLQQKRPTSETNKTLFFEFVSFGGDFCWKKSKWFTGNCVEEELVDCRRLLQLMPWELILGLQWKSSLLDTDGDTTDVKTMTWSDGTKQSTFGFPRANWLENCQEIQQDVFLQQRVLVKGTSCWCCFPFRACAAARISQARHVWMLQPVWSARINTISPMHLGLQVSQYHSGMSKTWVPAQQPGHLHKNIWPDETLDFAGFCWFSVDFLDLPA